MSVLINIPGVVPPPVHVRLTSTSITDIVTALDANSVVVAISVANETALAATIQIYRYDGTTDWLIWAKSIAANSSEVLSDLPVRGLTGNKIKATAGTANALTVTVVVGTVPGRNVGGSR